MASKKVKTIDLAKRACGRPCSNPLKEYVKRVDKNNKERDKVRKMMYDGK